MYEGHRKYFSMVRAVQKGIIPENEVSPSIKFLARNLSMSQIYEMMKNSEPTSIQEYLSDFVPSYKATIREKKIREAASNGGITKVGKSEIDRFSAYMLSQVLDRLTPDQKRDILNRPMDEAITIAYKLASRSLE